MVTTNTYYQQNKEAVLAWCKRYYQQNREVILGRSKRRYREKRDAILAYRHRPEVRRRQADLDRQRRFGISLDQIEQMAISQNGSCRICGKSRPLVVDHSHTSNRVRGLLCRGCNSKLAWFEHFQNKITEHLSNG